MTGKLIYLEAPEQQVLRGSSLFLAGGITNCPDWQAEMVPMLRTAYEPLGMPWDVTVCNPRRADFPIDDPSAADAQIKWEHEYLRACSMISFWFPKETLCPIVLYELGAWSMTNKKIFVGMDPDYQRRQDVEIQTKLARNFPYDKSLQVEIVYSLDELVAQIREEMLSLHNSVHAGVS